MHTRGTECTADAFVVVSAMTEDAAVTSTDEPMMGLAGSFDAFFGANHASIVRALALALGNDDLGRDAASEGFARALQRWAKVSRYDNPAGWVYRVGLNWARSRRRKTVRETELTAAPRNGVAAVERDLRVLPALQRLSDDHRDVVVAKYYLDWSEQRIADALDIRPGTVKSRLSRALQRLADDLGTA